MRINVVDASIILFILIYGIIGMKKGFFKSAVILLGTILIFILAYYLKDPLANYISLKIPFIDFKGLDALNIVFYQFISFVIVLAILSIALRIVIKLTSGLEKVLNWTIVLGIPSRILGFIFGLLEGYIIAFIILFLLNQPFIKGTIFDESKLMPKILDSSPVISNVIKETNIAINDIYKEIKEYHYNDNNKLNVEIIKTLLKYNVITKDYIQDLVDAKKIEIKMSSI